MIIGPNSFPGAYPAIAEQRPSGGWNRTSFDPGTQRQLLEQIGLLRVPIADFAATRLPGVLPPGVDKQTFIVGGTFGNPARALQMLITAGRTLNTPQSLANDMRIGGHHTVWACPELPPPAELQTEFNKSAQAGSHFFQGGVPVVEFMAGQRAFNYGIVDATTGSLTVMTV